jgi:rhomboid family GlyGly-CTERM serine protease
MGLFRSYSLPAGILLLSGLIGLWGESGRLALRYERAAIGGGELWRLMSGHFTHLGLSHLLLNGVGLVLVWYLVGRDYRAGQWLFILLVTIAGIDAGFWMLNPNLSWYVGLSGLLHGLLAAGILVGLQQRRLDMQILGALVLAKLLFEQLVGPLPGSESSSGGPVVVDAHLYGAMAGLLAAAIMRRTYKNKNLRSEH